MVQKIWGNVIGISVSFLHANWTNSGFLSVCLLNVCDQILSAEIFGVAIVAFIGATIDCLYNLVSWNDELFDILSDSLV